MRAQLRFYAELRDFLSPSHPSGGVSHNFDIPGSVKDVIEAYGVPHTEVDLIIANGESVDFGYRLADGDRISVYPTFEAFDITPIVKVRPGSLRQVRFVVDGLRRLARYLRLLGFDTAYGSSWSDHELVAFSVDQHRVLLTRDIGLLKHGAVTHGYYVRATEPRLQLIEIIERFHLSEHIQPFTRCMECNGLLEPVEKAAIADRLPPRVRDNFDEYSRCARCDRVYWQGSHHKRLAEIVEEARLVERKM